MENGGSIARAAAAYERALRALARRPLSEAELRAALGRAGHAPLDIESAVARLREARYLDDLRLAAQVVRAHARRGHAPLRARQELERRGVESRFIEEAFVAAETEDAPGPGLASRLAELLAGERLPLDARAVRRVYNRLLRAGFEESEVRAALEPYFLSQAQEEADGTAGTVRRGLGHAVHDDDGT